jgi:hypothetical protein
MYKKEVLLVEVDFQNGSFVQGKVHWQNLQAVVLVPALFFLLVRECYIATL